MRAGIERRPSDHKLNWEGKKRPPFAREGIDLLAALIEAGVVTSNTPPHVRKELVDATWGKLAASCERGRRTLTVGGAICEVLSEQKK